MTGAWYNEAQLKELLDGLLNLILEYFFMLVGVYFYWKCTNFQLNYVFNSMVSWPSVWKVFKNPLVLLKYLSSICLPPSF